MDKDKTEEERAAIVARMTNQDLFDAAFSALARWVEADTGAKAHEYRMSYLALRSELEKRLTRTGFLPTVPVEG